MLKVLNILFPCQVSANPPCCHIQHTNPAWHSCEPGTSSTAGLPHLGLIPPRSIYLLNLFCGTHTTAVDHGWGTGNNDEKSETAACMWFRRIFKIELDVRCSILDVRHSLLRTHIAHNTGASHLHRFIVCPRFRVRDEDHVELQVHQYGFHVCRSVQNWG